MLIVCILLLSGFGLYVLLKPPADLYYNEINRQIFQDQQLSKTKIDRIASYEQAHISRQNEG